MPSEIGDSSPLLLDLLGFYLLAATCECKREKGFCFLTLHGKRIDFKLLNETETKQARYELLGKR